MPNLYSINVLSQAPQNLSPEEVKAVVYHDCFDYPLDFSEIIKWKSTFITDIKSDLGKVSVQNGLCFLEGKSGLVYKRALRRRISVKKMAIARKAAGILSFVPTLKMLAVTGSLAMNNSDDESDIDLMVVARKGTLWLTRLLGYFLLYIFRFSFRRPNDRNQKDKLCLNIWLDESDLIWRRRNIYTAHEIAQIVPLINKDKTYEIFLFKNKWILNYWPNSVRILNPKLGIRNINSRFKVWDPILLFFENLAFKLQYQHMKPKITREIVSPTRAIFHPHDWSSLVIKRLST